MAGAVVPAAAADRFVDLARLGRTDAWSGVRGAASIVGWYLLAAVAYYTVGRAVHLPLGGAAAHIPHGGPAFLALVVTSVGFSLLSLFDGRLELAIGAHAAHNLMLAVAGIVLERSDHLFTRYHAVGWSAVVFALVQGTVAFL